MSGKSKIKHKHKPTAEEQRKAKEKAEAKAKKALEAAAKKKEAEEKARKADQEWLDSVTEDMSDDDKDELFRDLSERCKSTTMEDGQITLGCALPKKLKMSYCVDSERVGKRPQDLSHFDCPNGRVKTAKGCKLSPDVSKSLEDAGTCIDGAFVSEEEGGSYLSPYLPWGPVSARDKKDKPTMTQGNSSGVTIGTGVDLGAQGDPDEYLKELEKRGVSQETRDRLKPFLGKTQREACQALREAKEKDPLVFPQKDVEIIDTHAMESRVPQLKKSFDQCKRRRVAAFQKQIKDQKKGPNKAKIKQWEANIKNEKKRKKPRQARIQEWQAEIDEESKKPDQAKIDELQSRIKNAKSFDDLDCADQTILMSTYYHERKGIRAAHTQAYVNALIDGDADAAQQALKAKTKNRNPLIANRGKQELQYFQKAAEASDENDAPDDP
jgi:hypothetical protein